MQLTDIQTRECTCCKQVKSITDFSKKAGMPFGVRSQCKLCLSVKGSIYRSKNNEAINERIRRYKSENQDKVKASRKLYYEKNKEKINATAIAWAKKNKCIVNARKAMRRSLLGRTESEREYAIQYRAKNKDKLNLGSKKWRENNALRVKYNFIAWSIENPEKIAERHARRKRVKARLLWGNQFFIAEIYRLAQLRSNGTGIKWEVDHEVPLVSNIVCGLHVEDNLKVIPASINRTKSNKHWECMP